MHAHAWPASVSVSLVPLPPSPTPTPDGCVCPSKLFTMCEEERKLGGKLPGRKRPPWVRLTPSVRCTSSALLSLVQQTETNKTLEIKMSTCRGYKVRSKMVNLREQIRRWQVEQNKIKKKSLPFIFWIFGLASEENGDYGRKFKHDMKVFLFNFKSNLQ